MTDRTTKPPYQVPSMPEIAKMRGSNGRKVVSTFSGCGGSCLGFEMAGFDVVWANEFDPQAQTTYRANHPTTILDGRGIRTVTVEDVLNATGLEPRELDVFEGSPPCSKFSTAGKRAKSWGKVTASDSSIHQSNVEDLFFEYVRLLDGLQPKIFVAENVAGLAKGVAKGYLIDIIKALKACGYRVKVGDLDAQWLGVPQRRRRLIFMGIRNDLGLDPVFPKPLPYRYSVADACPWLAQGSTAPVLPEQRPSKATAAELTNLRPGQASDRYHAVAKVDPRESSPTVLGQAGGGGTRGLFVETPPIEPESDISRYAILVRATTDAPSPTLTASGESSSLAAVIHPTEMRKFSIAEVKRICSFPDDFQLTGSYGQQWERCGNAVPPLMMRAVAVEVANLLDQLPKRN